MKSRFFCILLSLFVLLPGWGQKTPPDLKLTGFSHPESVVLDKDNDVLFVSNIGEKEKGDGFISRLSRDGKILELKWITGLEDPKGLLVKGNKLYVTDNTQLVEMDIENSKILQRIPIPGAEFLNDIDVDSLGHIFVTDTRKNAIFRIKESGEIEEWLQSEKLEQPNGILPLNDKILIAAWSKNEPGNVLEVDRKSKEIKQVTNKGLGNLDGIQQVKANTYYISDWDSGKIYKVQLNGTVEEMFTADKSVGDILFLEAENKLVLPMNHQNELWWYSLK